MNTAHVHLLLNHLPLAGTLAGAVLLAVGIRRVRSRDLATAGLVALVVAAVLAIPTYLTGEGAEEVVEDLPGVTEAAIEQHEEAAVAALVALEITGLAALAALLLARARPCESKALAATALALSILSLGVTGWVANLGGHIRHTELGASEATNSHSTPAAHSQQPGE